MLKSIVSATIITVLVIPGAWAACPPGNPGNLPEAIEENGQRVVCIQHELAADTTRRSFEFELQSLEQTLQNLELQRRFDALPLPPPSVPWVIPKYSLP